jgi:hypothetical protein
MRHPMSAPDDPDEEHLEWSINQRAQIQRTLLALYSFVLRSHLGSGAPDQPRRFYSIN